MSQVPCVPKDGSALAEGGTAMPEARTDTIDRGSAVLESFCKYPLGLKSFLKFENKSKGRIAHIPEI